MLNKFNTQIPNAGFASVCSTRLGRSVLVFYTSLCVVLAACSGAGQAADGWGDRDGATLIDAAPGAPDAMQECTFYSDPVNGLPENSGSRQSPWGGLESLMTSGLPFSEGDTLCLLTGNHGAPRIYDQNYSSGVTIAALWGESPVISDLRIERSSGLTFEGITVDGSQIIDPTLDEKDRWLIQGDVTTHHITFRKISIQSAASIEGWTKADWYRRSMSAMDMRGPNISVEHSQILNVYHGLSLRGDHSLIAHCLIDNFAGDAIRGLGSFSTYEWNVVRDAYVNDYTIQHDDAFQAYNLKPDPKIEGVTIRNNQFMQFLDPITAFIEQNDLVSHEMQGVIISDGYADGWVVENNLVVNDHFHGITLYGARNCRVQNNTVIQSPLTTDLDVPWIRLTVQTKTGQRNFDNIIRNNLAAVFTTWDYDMTSVVENNSDVDQSRQSEYRQYFVDYDNQDYRLKADSPAVNAGVNEQVSALDIGGNPRVHDGTVDTGAYEFQE